MNAIGFRSGTNEISYAIVTGSSDNPELVTVNKLKQPAAFELPDALKWYRQQIISICKEFKVNACGVRTAEPYARSMGAAAKEGSIKRCHIEGVMIEASSSTGLAIIVGPLATISSLLESKNAKRYISTEEFRGIENWGKMSKEYKEAVLAGCAALRLLEE